VKRRPLPVAAALAATAALLLTACGSGDDKSSDNDKIAADDQRGGSEESPSPSASASGSVDRPEVTFPSDVENVFESWKTGDATKDAVLADAQGSVNAVDDAILRGDKDSSTLQFYRRGDALVSAAKWIQAWLDEDITWTGKTRYFDANIKVFDKDTAAISYCADESKAFNKNRKTGKVEKSPSGESPYVTYNTRLEKSEKGVWRTTSVLSKRGDKTCAP
jgi:hypothetical protein